MATTILITNYNTSYVTKQNEHIMQRSKNAHLIKFFVPEIYGNELNYDMKDFTFSLEVVLPSGEYKTLIIDKEDVTTKEGYVEYHFMLPSEYTIMSGDITFQPTFTYVDSDTATTYVRKVEGCSITVTPIEQWATLVTDSALGAVDQALIAIEAQVNALNAIGQTITTTKADNLDLTNDMLQLTANGTKIGDPVQITVTTEHEYDMDAADGTIDGIIDLNKIVTI